MMPPTGMHQILITQRSGDWSDAIWQVIKPAFNLILPAIMKGTSGINIGYGFSAEKKVCAWRRSDEEVDDQEVPEYNIKG